MPCSMDSKESDIPNGNSIAYVPLSESNEEQMMFSTVLCHEAIGHGFAKLADEFHLTQDEPEEVLSGGAENVFRNGVGRARTYLR